MISLKKKDKTKHTQYKFFKKSPHNDFSNDTLGLFCCIISIGNKVITTMMNRPLNEHTLTLSVCLLLPSTGSLPFSTTGHIRSSSTVKCHHIEQFGLECHRAPSLDPSCLSFTLLNSPPYLRVTECCRISMSTTVKSSFLSLRQLQHRIWSPRRVSFKDGWLDEKTPTEI